MRLARASGRRVRGRPSKNWDENIRRMTTERKVKRLWIEINCTALWIKRNKQKSKLPLRKFLLNKFYLPIIYPVEFRSVWKIEVENIAIVLFIMLQIASLQRPYRALTHHQTLHFTILCIRNNLADNIFWLHFKFLQLWIKFAIILVQPIHAC